jgi:hypothetical protein
MFPFAAAAQGVIGLIQTGISAAKAANLPDPKQYTVGPEMRLAYNMSRRRADEGYSAEEKAAFEQMLARQGTAAKRMLQNVGLSGVGSAAANIMGIDAMNQFAAQGSNIRRQNFGQFASMAGQIQGVQNMEIGRFNEQLRAEETALGQATQAGIGNMFGGMQSGQNFMQNERAMEAYAKTGWGGGFGGFGGFGGSRAPIGTTSGFDANGNPVSNAPQFNTQGVGVGGAGGAPTGFSGFNPNFQGGGMGDYGQQPNMGFLPPHMYPTFSELQNDFG